MSTVRSQRLRLAIALAGALFLNAPSAVAGDGAGHGGDRRAQHQADRAALEAMSPAERQARMEQMRAQRQSQMAERRAKIRDRIDSLPPDQQAAARERVRRALEERRRRTPPR